MFQFEIKKDALLKFIGMCPYIRDPKYDGLILRVNNSGFVSMITTSGYILIIQEMGIGTGNGSCRILYKDLMGLKKILRTNTEISDILKVNYDNNNELRIFEINKQVPEPMPLWYLTNPESEYDYNSVIDNLHKISELEIVPSDLKKIFKNIKAKLGSDWKKTIIEISHDKENGLIGKAGEITENIIRKGFYGNSAQNISNSFKYKSVMFYMEPFLRLMGRKRQIRLIGYENGFVSMECGGLRVFNTGCY